MRKGKMKVVKFHENYLFASAGRRSSIIQEISLNVPLVIDLQSEEIHNLYCYLFTLNLFVCAGPKWKSFAKGLFFLPESQTSNLM